MHDDRWHALTDVDRRRLLRAARRWLAPADAEDAVQDAYLRALETWGGDAPAPTVAPAWLHTVTQRLAIDRIRRARWWQQWQDAAREVVADDPVPSAESTAAARQSCDRLLWRLASRLSPSDAAALLLHAVFEAGHAELAAASGRTEAACRQQLRRALLRLRESGASASSAAPSADDPEHGPLFRCLQLAVLRADAAPVWAVLRQPPVRSAVGAVAPRPAAADRSAMRHASAPRMSAPGTSAQIVALGGQLALALTLDGQPLCVLPLGVRPADDADCSARPVTA